MSQSTPLFVPSVGVLLSRLRLSAIEDTGSDVFSVFEEALDLVRCDFFQHLGEARILEILALSVTTSPATANEYLRLLASRLEITRVKYYLLRDLPVHIVGNAQERVTWNQEGIVETASIRDIEILRKGLDDVWLRGVSQLAGEGSEGIEAAVFSVETIDTVVAPGATSGIVWGTE